MKLTTPANSSRTGILPVQLRGAARQARRLSHCAAFTLAEVMAALLFLAHALRRAGVPFARWLAGLETASPGWTRTLAALTSRIDRTRPGGGYLLGVALGFLPCGFLYAALAAAAATADPLRGGLAMLAFGLGTVPALVLVGIAGQATGRVWQRATARLAPAVLLVNAGLLAALAWQKLAALV